MSLGRKPTDPPVPRLSLQEVFADLHSGARESKARRDRQRIASTGMPATRRWKYGGDVVEARTRSEARAAFKRLRKVHRLPAGQSPLEIVEAP